ncbi:MAG TPA: amidohydrolase family protein [Myxococcales bacterium]
MTILAILLAAQAVNVPELPKDVPKGATFYTVLTMGQPAGQLAVWKEADRLRAFYQYNDRGRGPKTYSTVVLEGGLPVREETEGNDYMKDPVRETFSVADGTASWKSKAEQGTRKLQGPAFYVSMYGPPVDVALLARAALDHGGRIALLPAGEARVEKLLDHTAEAGGRSQKVSLYAVTGLDFSPDYFWLDPDRELFAVGETWYAVVRAGWEGAMPGLIKASQEAQHQRARRLAERLAHRPRGLLFFHDATVFDADFARMVPHLDVTVDGSRIVRVEPTGPVPAGAEVIEAAGKTLIPGLWDMHAHVSPNDGMLNLAAGVTTVRDLANDTDELLARRKRIEEGTELGTRIVMAGFMDGPGPYQGPTKVLVADEKTGREWVDKYAALGMVQIKLYSSLKPELVKPIAEEAHRKGLRVSGHIPAGLTASEAVKLGYDEIQHVNFLVLNFMPDVKDTRTPARFLEPAKRAADLDLGSQEVRAFVQLLHDRHTTLDPTLATFESLFLDRAGEIAPGYRTVADRLPVQVRRGFMAGQLPVPPGMDPRYRASWKKMLALVRELYEAGVPIEAGTDALAGFALHRELELDVEAGIPAPEVLKLATLGAARIMGMEKDLGTVRPGKLADLALIDGDPSLRISDVRKTVLTVKDGVVYRPAELYVELGVKPQ